MPPLKAWRAKGGGAWEEHAAPKEDPAVHTLSSVPLLLILPLVGFRANISLCFGGHSHLSGLMLCSSTALLLFLLPFCGAFCET